MKNKRRKQVRTRDWHAKHEDAFTHDLARHRKAAAGITRVALPVAPENLRPNAVVIGHVGQYAFVSMDGAERMCLIDTALGERTSTLLAPGDEVLVEQSEGQYIVRGVAPRRTKLSRLAHVHRDVVEQVVAANVALLVIVTSAAQPRFKPGVVDRYLITAEVGGVEPVLVINKMDLVDTEPPHAGHYRELGLAVILASCATGQGIPELRDRIAGRVSVLGGQSGVGKTSLLNAIAPGLDLETAEVSAATEKGKHTTSRSRLFILPGNIRVIDTPGIRSLGLWRVSSEEVGFYFPEIAEHGQRCRFRNCRHMHEPGCAVRDAVEDGSISRRRYESYKHIRKSLEEKEEY